MVNSTELLVKLPELPVIEIVDDLIQVYKEYMVIRAALKMKIFDWMAANGSSTIDAISAGTGVPRDYMASLMGMLYYLDLVRKHEDTYGLSPSASLHFVTTSLYYQGDVILALSEEGTPWAGLDEYILHPETKRSFHAENQYAVASRAEQEIRGMVQNVTTVVSRWDGFSRATRMFELGSGHGLYAIAACQIHPDLTATVFQPPGSTLLQENISRFGMENRITVCSDIRDFSGDSYDIFLASHALYPYQEQPGDIIRRIAASLNDGGLYVSNHWCSRESEGTGSQGLYELELGIHNRYHLIQNREAYEQICKEAGLAIFQTGMMRSAYGESTIHMALKKGE